MREYRFGLSGSDRVVVITATSFHVALHMFREQLKAEGLYAN